MPELPEIETVKRELQKAMLSRDQPSPRIIEAKMLQSKMLQGDGINEFKKKVEGSAIETVDRRAKILTIGLTSGYSLLIHLKMTGQLVYLPAWAERSQYERAVFRLSNGYELRFNDMRRFGYIKTAPTAKLDAAPEIAGLGPEPLERSFSRKEFIRLIRSKRQGKIKPLLMNQRFIAGIGNIYADEICFYAGVLPIRPVNTLTDGEIDRLHKGIKTVLSAAIERGGTTFRDYVSASGERGGYVSWLKVYRRTGESCFRCGGTVERTKLGGRGTHFCPKCQK